MVDNSQFELLAPGGDIDSIKAAIVAGADAVYCGLNRFNARNRATNLSIDELNQVVNLAHQHRCKVFVTLNILILESEITAVILLLNRLVKTDIDGVIVQDLGLAYILRQHYPMLDVHASTQLNTHNEGQIRLLKQLGVSRVNLSRELNINEITRLASYGHQHDVLMEVFVHGSYCIGFSGLCYISSERNGASGNRGRCSQPCRDPFQPTQQGVEHPLNMKDNSAFTSMQALADAGVYSLKVEGRIKGAHYVYTVVDNWRRQIDGFCASGHWSEEMTELHTVYNRDFSDGYLQGEIGREMYIDNPRCHSVTHFASREQANTPAQIKQIKQRLYDEKTTIINTVKQKTEALSVTKPLVSELASGRRGVHETVIWDTLTGSSPGTEPQSHQSPGSPALMVLIADPAQVASALATASESGARVCYQLPNALAHSLKDLVALFEAHPALVPLFPAILIDKDYDAALALLDQVKPALIISNNSGIGWAAAQSGVDWIAGPQMNSCNSFTLMALKEMFGCRGAFISNEINQKQMQRLVVPDNFELCYSLYHPLSVMTSRQCLFQQSIGCKKEKINKGCLPRCSKHTEIINLNNAAYIVDKQKGELNQLYSQYHFLNTGIVDDLPGLYSQYLVDLRDIRTHTRSQLGLPAMVQGFTRLLAREPGAEAALHATIAPTTRAQYLKGL